MRVGLVAAVALSVVAAAGCSGSGADESTSTSSTSATTAEDGTTAPGTTLKLGKSATVRYSANRKQESLIKLRVTSVRRGKIAHLKNFDLTDKTKKSSVYYVRARVTNVGNGDLSGQPLTLYGAASNRLVLPPVQFGSTFNRCDYAPLPEKFRKNESATVCLVLLAPKKGKISEVQWRPADNAEPISWLLR